MTTTESDPGCAVCGETEGVKVHNSPLPIPYSSGYCPSCSERGLEEYDRCVLTLAWLGDPIPDNPRADAIIGVSIRSALFAGKTPADLFADAATAPAGPTWHG